MGRASIRLRLALWCAGLVTVSGAIVVLAVLALSGQLLHDRVRPPRPLAPIRAAARPGDRARPRRHLTLSARPGGGLEARAALPSTSA